MAGIDIGPIHIGGDEPPPPPKGLTLADVIAQLPEGVTISAFHTHDSNGKGITDRAPAPTAKLQPGDTIEIKGNGRTWQTSVNADVSDIAPWVQTSAVKGPTSEDTAALAQAAVAKANAGQQPSQSELAAYFKLQAQQAGASGKGQYAPPIAGYSGPIEPHHAGEPNGATDLFAPPGTPVQSPTSGTIVRAGPFGAAGNDIYLKGDDGRYYDFEHIDGLKVQPGDTVTAGQPLAVVATLDQAGSSVGPTPHLHFAVTNADGGIDYDNHGTASDFDTTGFLKGLYSGQLPALNLGPKPSLHALGDKLYKYDPATGAATVVATGDKAQQPTLHSFGDKLYRYDPATGTASVIVDASGEKAPTVHQIGNILYQYDPGTKQWQQAIQGPESPADLEAKQKLQGAVTTAMQQRQQTVAYIKQQLASGAISPQAAMQYNQQSQDYFDAALKGTTPWQMYQEQQQQDTQRATIAKDLLDTKLQAQSTMADALLGHALSGLAASKYGQLAPGALSGLYEGVMNDVQQRAGGQPLSDLAQSLLQAIAPRAQAAGLDPRAGVLANMGGPPAPGPTPDIPGLPAYLQANPQTPIPPDVAAQLGTQPTLAAAGTGGL